MTTPWVRMRRSKAVPPGHRPGRQEAVKRKRSSSSSLSPSPSPSPATVPSKAESDGNTGRQLLLSTDYGTKTLSAAYRICQVGESPDPSRILDVHFSGHTHYAPQAVAWSDDGELYWGHNVQNAIDRELIQSDNVIELWKLLLYKNHRSSRIAQDVEAQLKTGRRKMTDLLTVHMKAIVAEIKCIAKANERLDFTAKDIDDLPMRLFLSVPQMWKASANRFMTRAAKAAGIPYVELVYEPQCAAAYFTHQIKDRLPQQVSEGDVILIADIGGGTGDFVSYEFCQDAVAGAKVGLKLVGTAEGALCGSEFVNQNFIAWLQKRAGNFKAKCKALGLSTRECVKEASRQFENIKHLFTENKKKDQYVTIRGSQGAKEDTWDIKLTNTDIRSFFDPVIEEIMKCIDAQLTERTKTLIIPGGFGRSEYLLTQLEKRYKDRVQILGQATPAVGAYEPVSRGALYRYKDVQIRGLAAKESFGIGQVEIYDPAVHTYTKGVTDDYDGETSVYGCWTPLMNKGDAKEPGKPFTTETWQHDTVTVKQKFLDISIFLTEDDTVAAHDSIFTSAIPDNKKLRPQFELWHTMEIKLPDLKKEGFELQPGHRGAVYEFYWRLLLECDGANISIKWQMARPGTQPYNELGQRCAANVELTADEVFEICDDSFNPFPRTSPS